MERAQRLALTREGNVRVLAHVWRMGAETMKQGPGKPESC